MIPFVSRERYEEMQDKLEAQLKDLQKRFDALQAKADALASSVLEADKQEPEVQEETIGFTPTIAHVRNAANGWAAERNRKAKQA